MVLFVKLLVTFIKMCIFQIKHDDDMLGDAADAVLGSLMDSVKGLFGDDTSAVE